MALFSKRFASLILGLVLTTQFAVAGPVASLWSFFHCGKQKVKQVSSQTLPVPAAQSQSIVSKSFDQTTGKDAKASVAEAKEKGKQSSTNVIQAPLVIILNGTSSAGKSSITKQMLTMLGKDWEVISIDDYITDEFFKRYPQALLDNHNIEGICLKIFQSSGVGDFLANGNVLVAMADRIHRCCVEGKSVIVDVVLYKKNFDFFISRLKDCNVRQCLVYCPLLELVHRVSLRNERASCKDATILEKMERRDLARAVRRFGTLYTYGSNRSIDTLTKADRDAVLSLVQKDYADSSLTSEGKQTFEQFCVEFEKNMGSNQTDETIQSVLPYDVMVNSGVYNPHQCASRIIDYISSQGYSASNAISVG